MVHLPMIFFRVTSLSLGQSYDCPSDSEVTLKDIMGNNHPYQMKQTQWTVAIFLGIKWRLFPGSIWGFCPWNPRRAKNQLLGGIRILKGWTIQDICVKAISNSNLVKSCWFITSVSFIEIFWNFAQSTAISNWLGNWVIRYGHMRFNKSWV